MTTNYKTGQHPVTGKEYIILNNDNGVLSFSGQSYQTYIAAHKAKQSGQLVIEASKLPNTIKRWDWQKKQAIKLAQELQLEINAIEEADETEIPKAIKSIQLAPLIRQIKVYHKQRRYDTSALK